MAGVLNRRKPGDGSVAVRYTPCARSEGQADGAVPEHYDEISIVEEDPRENDEEEDEGGGGGRGRGGGGGEDFGGRGGGGGSGSSGFYKKYRTPDYSYRRGVGVGGGGSDSESGRVNNNNSNTNNGGGSNNRYSPGFYNEGGGWAMDDDDDDNDDNADNDIVGHNGNNIGDHSDVEDRYDNIEDNENGELQLFQHPDTPGGSSSGGAALSSIGNPSHTAVTANGPRNMPPGTIFTSQTSSDRTKLIGERLSSCDKISLSSPIYSNKTLEQRAKSTSKQSLLDLFSTRLDKVKVNRKRFSLANTSLIKKPRPSDGNVNALTSTQRRQRRKDIKRDFGRKSIKTDNRIEQAATSVSSERDGCNWTFVFDPSGRLCYWWSSVVSIAFLYNFWVIIYRFAFQEIDSDNIALWFTLDYSADFLYILDIAFHFRCGYLEDGVLQTDTTKLRIHYMNTTTFYIDCLCLLPIDFLYLSIGFCSIVRGFRLVKVYKFWSFLDRTERHTNYPNLIRTTSLIHYLLALFHWNACLYYKLADSMEGQMGSTWGFPKDTHNKNNTLLNYLHALHLSVLTLSTIGDPPTPNSLAEYTFVTCEMVFSLLLFATVLGHIANIVTNVSAARKEFQARLDAVKTYMALRRVPLKLQDRVIKWFDYLWICNKSSDEDKSLNLLPDRLKAEIAIHVHLDTLKRVEIFQSTEAGFLCELVLRLRPVLFSPGDYICRKGEVGKEMYIVNRGRLHVVADNGRTVLATLKPGSYFGEISILNMGTAGNRRTASVRSVGYSDLFCLSKNDLWDVLKEYPAARVNLEAIAVKRLERYKKAPLEKASLARSRSTPGLVESTGKIPLQSMIVSRHSTLPPGLIKKDGQSAWPAGTSAREDPSTQAPLHNAQSEDNLISRCVDRRLSSDSQQHIGNMTTSMTISSNISYPGTPPQKSPGFADGASNKNPFSTPSHHAAPQLSHQNELSLNTLANGQPPALNLLAATPQQALTPHFTFQNVPFINAAGQPINFLSPFCATPAPANFPSTPSTFPPPGTPTPHPHAQHSQQAAPVPPTVNFQPASPSHTGLILPTHSSSQGVSDAQSLFQGPLSPLPPAQCYSPIPPSPALLHPHSSQGTNIISTPASTVSSTSHPQPQQLQFSPLHQLTLPSLSGQFTPAPTSPIPTPHVQRSADYNSAADGQSETLLKEISRLRERLAQLEGENTALTVKLNQQQWDVESRLTELEMHICQSDSVPSTDVDGDSLRPESSRNILPHLSSVNRESII